MKLSEYLFQRIAEAGAGTIFGLPGDFALPLFATLDRLGARVVTFTHEPALGYAADAFARLNGFAAAVVTYGAGGLNLVNAVAQAYAEKSPVLVVSGAPEILSRRRNLFVHHRVKTFESQKRIYDEICCASVIVDRVEDAASEIDYVINKVLSDKRPGYLEIPRDMTDCEIPVPDRNRLRLPKEVNVVSDPGIASALGKLEALIAKARQPVLYVGVEVKRLGLEGLLKAFVENANLPFTTSMEGKAVLPESHPNFVGTYMGAVGSESARIALESADLVINVGTMMSDVNLGMFSGGLDPARMAHVTDEGLAFPGDSYPNVTLGTALSFLARNGSLKKRPFPESWRQHPETAPVLGPITTDGIVALINEFIRKRPTVVTLDVGDILFASSGIRADVLISPSYYASMGFSVPAAVASCLACPDRRTIALVGDGAFQMTGVEIATAKRYGLAPTVIVMNNSGFGTMRALDACRPYYDVPHWDFAALGSALGVVSERAATLEDLSSLLDKHDGTKSPVLIEAMMANDSASESLKKMGEANRKFRDGGTS
jgi:indolepyruvate decarboxylase